MNKLVKFGLIMVASLFMGVVLMEAQGVPPFQFDSTGIILGLVTGFAVGLCGCVVSEYWF